MKTLLFCLPILMVTALGCNLFSNSNNSAQSTNNSAASSVNTNTAASPYSNRDQDEAEDEDREYAKDDYVGRWGKSLSGADHVIEFRGDGTGTITLDEGSPNQAKQDFTWKLEAKHAVFTIKSPVVNKKVIDSGTYTVHAKLTDGGKKLETDFDTLWRGKGESEFEQK